MRKSLPSQKDPHSYLAVEKRPFLSFLAWLCCYVFASLLDFVFFAIRFLSPKIQPSKFRALSVVHPTILSTLFQRGTCCCSNLVDISAVSMAISSWLWHFCILASSKSRSIKSGEYLFAIASYLFLKSLSPAPKDCNVFILGPHFSLQQSDNVVTFSCNFSSFSWDFLGSKNTCLAPKLCAELHHRKSSNNMTLTLIFWVGKISSCWAAV